jgi:phosphate transport system protein
MTTHFRRETEELKSSILSLGAVVEEHVWRAVRSVETRDTTIAQSVIENDVDVDSEEVEIEEECLKLLALYQPVAVDLRFIVAVLKINNDLERIGDLAVNIAQRSLTLASQQPIEIGFDLSGMAEKARQMLRRSLDALVKMDTSLAREVCSEDEEVDEMNRRMYDLVKEQVVKAPDRVHCLLQFLLVSRNLERIADLSTNIAEDVIYMVEGVIVRHRVDQY